MSWKTILGMHGMAWMFKDIWYRLDWRKPTPSSVKKFLIENVAITRHLTKQGVIPVFSERNHDKKIRQIQKYVMDTVAYEIDSVRFGVVEKWQSVDETIQYERGDCEDMSILIYSIARVNGISPTQIRLVTGTVKLKDDKTGGHCWIEFCSDETFNWYSVDACYYPNLDKFKYSIIKNLDTKYIKTWFMVTDFFCE